MFALMTAIIGFGACYFYFTVVAIPQLLIRTIQSAKQATKHEIQQLKEKVLALDIEKSKLERTRKDEIPSSDVESLKTRVSNLLQFKRKTIGSIQKWCRAALVHRFGQGPYYVQVTVELDTASNIATSGTNNTENIILEMASETDMPHTVYWFLLQVSAQMYDGTSFHRNAGHVIQAGPAPNFLTKPGARLMQPFRESGLMGVLFQEYSDRHPHEKYTVGLAGRPGGPDWYISMQDNTRNHGPGGQGSYDDPSEADPCFGKIVEGYENVADLIHKSEVEDGSYKRMKHNVAITSMRIVHFDPVTKTVSINGKR